jgi:aminoglycoside phosphotransferase (APT) family kinase protein
VALRIVHHPNCIIQTGGVDVASDPGFASLLRRFGVTADDCLGHGGEARVYALGHDRVLRVLHRGGRADDVVRRHRLVCDLRRARPPFALPDVLEVGEAGGRVFAVERRLPGRSVLDALGSCVGAARSRLIESHLETAAALGDLYLAQRRDYGDLVLEDPITTPTWHAYLARRAAANLSRSTSEFRSVDPDALVDGLPDAAAPAFVHLDAFAGNMLTDGTGITAVIDIGSICVAGDRRFDPLSAAVYLASPEITPVATAADIDVAMAWLRAAGLHDWFDPARRWLAAFWSFAVDDPNVLAWCRRVLLASSPRTGRD